jgi:hypothetical protein
LGGHETADAVLGSDDADSGQVGECSSNRQPVDPVSIGQGRLCRQGQCAVLDTAEEVGTGLLPHGDWGVTWFDGDMAMASFDQQGLLQGLPAQRGMEPARPSVPAHRSVRLIFIIDGLGCDYLDSGAAPFLSTLFAEKGEVVSGLWPTVTNVNNAAIACAPPAVTGITGNSFLESAQRERSERLLGQGLDYIVNSQDAPAEIVDAVGTPPHIYSSEVNIWLVRCLAWLITNCQDLDTFYVHTKDYPMHMWAPGEAGSQEHLRQLDAAIRAVVDAVPDAEILLTADHGMNAKTRALDLGRILAARGVAGVRARCPSRRTATWDTTVTSAVARGCGLTKRNGTGRPTSSPRSTASNRCCHAPKRPPGSCSIRPGWATSRSSWTAGRSSVTLRRRQRNSAPAIAPMARSTSVRFPCSVGVGASVTRRPTGRPR